MPKSIQEYLKEPYARILVPDEAGGYSAEILEFPGCFAEGETADETMQALERAAESWIQAALDQGQEIPSPFMNQGYGGKVALRLPRSVHRKAAQFASRDGTSLNQYLLSSVAAGIGASELYSRLVNQLTETILQKIEDHLAVAANRVTTVAFVNNWFSVPGLSIPGASGESRQILRNLHVDYLSDKPTKGTGTKPVEVALNG
jgi:predicted RNase H-like HicB family nuclease